MINGSNNSIGGASSGAGNVISGNTYVGLEIDGSSTMIGGNLVGTNPTGTAAVANLVGMEIGPGMGTTIGGTIAAARNVISGNSQEGIELSTSSSVIEGNFIGTDATGTFALGNEYGVDLYDASDVTVGGTTAAVRNIVSGNLGHGIDVDGDGHTPTTGNLIEGNWIGTDTSGTHALGNAGDAIAIDEASGNTVGGTASGTGNIIAFNQGNGVVIGASYFPDTEDDAILGNSIYSNAKLGIDLEDDGVTLKNSEWPHWPESPAKLPRHHHGNLYPDDHDVLGHAQQHAEHNFYHPILSQTLPPDRPAMARERPTSAKRP